MSSLFLLKTFADAHISSLSLLKVFADAPMSNLQMLIVKTNCSKKLIFRLKKVARAHKGPLIRLKLTRSVPTCPY